MKTIKFCSVLKPSGFPDCTANGITAQFDSLHVIVDVPYLMMKGFYDEYYFDKPDEKAVERYVEENGLDPKMVLIYCDKLNNPIYTPFLKPLDSVYGSREIGGRTVRLLGPMAGGNYVVFKDEEHKEHVVRVHDRYETQEAYDALSIG